MIFTETKLKGAYTITIETKDDERGYFGRIYCKEEFAKHRIDFSIAQSNIGYNKKKATLRGMHMQGAPHKEAKLVQCICGSLYDVIVDMRVNSPTLYQWTAMELSANNNTLLYIPEGFAHGYITLEDDTKVLYMMSEFYKPGAEQPLLWNDPFFKIHWPLQPQVMSEKDKAIPLFQPLDFPFNQQ